MTVGVITWEIQVFEAQSLKGKRRVVKGLKERLRARLNLSVAETAHHDTWQRAEITAAVVATDRRRAESLLDKADSLVEREAGGRIITADRIFY